MNDDDMRRRCIYTSSQRCGISKALHLSGLQKGYSGTCSQGCTVCIRPRTKKNSGLLSTFAMEETSFSFLRICGTNAKYVIKCYYWQLTVFTIQASITATHEMSVMLSERDAKANLVHHACLASLELVRHTEFNCWVPFMRSLVSIWLCPDCRQEHSHSIPLPFGTYITSADKCNTETCRENAQ